MIRYLTAGESHGESLIGIVEGMPAGVALTDADINEHLGRRWLGFGRGGRAKIESDQVEILSGVRFGETMGSPIALRIANVSHHKDKSGWPDIMAIDGDGKGVQKVTLPRPGHADLVGVQKYGFDDIRPVIERASARETAMRVACCSIARTLLRHVGIEVGSHVVELGGVKSDSWEHDRDGLLASGARSVYQAADASEVRMLSDEVSQDAVERIKQAKADGDSLGGSYEVIVTGVQAGLGSYVHWDRRLDGRLAQAILSIQGQKAVEIGNGLDGARKTGSEFHDPIIKDGSGTFFRATNRGGGVEGGVSTGMPIIVRGTMKPIPTLIKPLQTVDIETGESQPTRYERSDVTSVPAASTVAEATVAWVVAEALLERYGGDSFNVIKDRIAAEEAARG